MNPLDAILGSMTDCGCDFPAANETEAIGLDDTDEHTIATEIAALICAADIARRNGDTVRAARYETTADTYQRSVETWTATTNANRPKSSTRIFSRACSALMWICGAAASAIRFPDSPSMA